MPWIEPKTNWTVNDRFNASDYNRINNNITILRNMLIRLGEAFSLKPGGGRKTYADYFYADEVNTMVDNLKVISKNLGYVYHSLEDMTMYEDNGRTMTYDELNRIEQELSSIYNQVLNRTEGRRKLQFNFGDKEDF